MWQQSVCTVLRALETKKWIGILETKPSAIIVETISEAYVPRIILSRRSQVAKFLVPDWGDKVGSGKGLPYRPASRSQLYTPVRDYEFNYKTPIWVKLSEKIRSCYYVFIGIFLKFSRK